MNYLKITAAALVLGLCSCNTDSDEQDERNYFTDIVTYETVTGEGTIFTFQENDDMPLVTLTTSQSLSNVDFKMGTRVVIQYWPHSNRQYVSGPISVLGVANVIGSGDAITTTDATAAGNWQSNPVEMYKLWRTGKYLNFIFMANLSYTHNIATRAVVDEATLTAEYPDVYILYGPDDSFSSNTGYIFGSYNIDNVWTLESCRGLTVHYTDMDNNSQQLRFYKTGTNVTPQQ